MPHAASNPTVAKPETAKPETASQSAPVAFNFNSEAELFPTRSKKTKPRSMGYRRFARAADAIRFAIEDLPPELLLGAYLEVEQGRFDGDGIRRLYESAEYPLARRAARDD